MGLFEKKRVFDGSSEIRCSIILAAKRAASLCFGSSGDCNFLGR
jgi:hypothetical protein